MNKTEMLEKISKCELFIQSVSKEQTKSIINILYEKHIYNERKTFKDVNSNTIYISSNNRGDIAWTESLEFVQEYITYEEFINAIYGLAITLPLTIKDFTTDEIREELTSRDTQRVKELTDNINYIIKELNSLGYELGFDTKTLIENAELDQDNKVVYLYDKQWE